MGAAKEKAPAATGAQESTVQSKLGNKPTNKRRILEAIPSRSSERGCMTVIRIKQNAYGCWLVRIGDRLYASFLTHSKALEYGRWVKL